jgi:glycosyltransferase involved in cell wall biosynthesis
VTSVLHLSTWDNRGGSGRAAYRLHAGLRRLGLRSRMLVAFRQTGDPDVRILGGRRLGRLDRACGRVVDATGLQYLWYPSSLALPRHPWVREADVIQVFNTHGGWLSHRALAPLSRGRPLVWRLSDMWALTGHCGYAYECERWRTGCGACPHLDEYPRLPWDTSALLWRVKRRVYAASRLVLVAPTAWLAGLARTSPLLGRFPVHVIPNGLDLERFRPRPRAEARARLGLPARGPMLFFGAASVTDARKGAAYLAEALARLGDGLAARLTLLVGGAGGEGWRPPGPFTVHRLGFVDDDERLALAYAAADVFVLPTVAENLANAILESLACGTPVVAFAVGGVPEAVRHLETGYLAAPRDAGALAAGIRRLLEDDEARATMARRARGVAEAEYGLDLQARRFARLYDDVLRGRRGAPEAAAR